MGTGFASGDFYIDEDGTKFVVSSTFSSGCSVDYTTLTTTTTTEGADITWMVLEDNLKDVELDPKDIPWFNGGEKE